LRDRGGKVGGLRMIGSELGIELAWLYFEIDAGKQLAGSTLENRVFLELLPDQVNTVILKGPGPARTLEFRRGQTRKKL
jgi:hypothetical protein